MKIRRNHNLLKSSIGIAMAVCLFFFSGIGLPVLSETTDAYFREAISKAGMAYATCRAINASVSIIKDSNLQLEPAGVGISLAVGQALDPIDDMTERLSDVLVTAITSLGIQKLVYEMSLSLVPPMLAVLLLMLSILVWFNNERLKLFQQTLVRFAFLIIVARFCLPMSSLVNAFVYHHFFAHQISEARKELAVGSADLEKLRELSIPEANGVFGTIKSGTTFLKRKTIAFKDAFLKTVSHMDSMVENLLKLTFLYVGIALIQVILLPLAVFWLLIKTANAVFPTNFPVVLHHPRPAENKQTN